MWGGGGLKVGGGYTEKIRTYFLELKIFWYSRIHVLIFSVSEELPQQQSKVLIDDTLSLTQSVKSRNQLFTKSSFQPILKFVTCNRAEIDTCINSGFWQQASLT